MSVGKEVLEIGYSNFILLMRIPRPMCGESLASSLAQLALPPGSLLGI